MLTLKGGVLSAIILAAGMFAATASADDVRRYGVTIANLTRGQVLSPYVAASHNGAFQLFESGGSASAGLALLAEDGDPGDTSTAGTIAYEVANAAGVDSVVHGDPGQMTDFTPPGASISFDITASGEAKYLSLATMLVTTNDAFAAVRGLRLPGGVGSVARTRGPAYDAGSETNNEDCGFIPGPPCGNGGVRDTAGAEGFIHIHAGIHGVAELVPAMHDWRNPVIEVTVVRLSDD